MDRIISKSGPLDKNPKVSPSAVTVTNQQNTLGLRASILSGSRMGH
jgi:hypothetical protein